MAGEAVGFPAVRELVTGYSPESGQGEGVSLPLQFLILFEDLFIYRSITILYAQ